MKNTTLPAIIFAAAVLSFYAVEPFTNQTLSNLNLTFYIISGIILSTLFIFNRSKPAFILLIGLISYITINHLKQIYGIEFEKTAAYHNLSFWAALNFLIFYFLPEKKLLKVRNTYLLLFLLGQLCLIEHLSRKNIDISFLAGTENKIIITLFGITLISLFLQCSKSGDILETGLFFAIFNFSLGFAYSGGASGQILFFTSAVLTLALTLGEHIYTTLFSDIESGFLSRQSFLHHAKSFPLKYSIGIILIDDYERLKKIFKKSGMGALIKMISRQLEGTETEAQIYRYERDEFVLLFRGEDKNEAFERLEKIRRLIASSSYNLKGYNKPIKLTVSGSVSEKKRSDANAIEVLLRADKALQKSYRFAQNITTKA